MRNNTITNLQKEFITEASAAPKLFRDLAKVEHYIAESYKTRSFIELMQNADDANSSAFGIYSRDNALIVANNGSPFTVHDIEALCRSGSSNKIRGGSSIGYRGIGFKSVINLAKRIYIFSGDFKFYFDKEETCRLLPGIPEVPLIRVLHPYSEHENLHNITWQIEELAGQRGYNTFFVFCDTDNRIIKQELEDFDRSSLLFLNNVCHFTCQADDIQREITITKQCCNNQRIIKIREGTQTDTWAILASPKDAKDMIALKMEADIIISATLEESVVHSFTPTIEFTGAFIKINGDYSTDPSRKNIDFDDISQRSFVNVLALLVDTIVDILEEKIVCKGFFTPFVNVPNVAGTKFKAKLYNGIIEALNNKKMRINGEKVAFNSIRLCPEWLNHEDYEKICNAGFCAINSEMLTTYPELPTFLELVGVKPLNLYETMCAVNKTKLSITGAAQITTKITSQYSFDLTKERVAEISAINLFPKGNKMVSSAEVASTDSLQKDFVSYLADHAEAPDLKQFLSKTEIKPGGVLQATIASPPSSQKLKPVETPFQPATCGAESVFKTTPNLQKWRSAEKNALEYIQSLKGVLSASDVSTANMGYDLEVMLESGSKIFIEVKSVKSFSESFKITNNEYSSAHNYGQAYFIGIVINDDNFEMRLIQNPTSNLNFQKQIERWSWYCDSYKEQMTLIQDIIGDNK